MPNMVIDQQETFASPPLAMSAGPKLEFQSTAQAVNRDGEKKWVVQAAVTYRPEGPMAAQAEVISVGITGGDDPALTVTPGTPVEFRRLRVGFSPPEAKEGGRVRGGRPYFLADGVRSVSAAAKASAAA